MQLTLNIKLGGGLAAIAISTTMIGECAVLSDSIASASSVRGTTLHVNTARFDWTVGLAFLTVLTACLDNGLLQLTRTSPF